MHRVVALRCPKCGNQDDVDAPTPACSAGCGTLMEATHIALVTSRGTVLVPSYEYDRRKNTVLEAARALLAGTGTLSDLKQASDELVQLEAF